MVADTDLKFQQITAFPVVHQKLYFTQELLKLVSSCEFDLICVELPEFSKNKVLEACSFLPDISAVCITDKKNQVSFIPVDPADPIIMGVLLGMKQEIPVEFIDKNLPYIPHDLHYFTGDDYPVFKLGIEKYYSSVKDKIKTFIKPYADMEREKYMAFKLDLFQKKYKNILFICGLSHWEGVRYFLSGIDKLNLDSLYPGLNLDDLKIYKVSHDSISTITAEMPYLISYFLKKNMPESSIGLISEKNSQNKHDIISNLFFETANKYSGDIAPQRIRTLINYCQKLARESGFFTPDLIDILTAAKQIINDEFALILQKLACTYYHYREDSPFPIIQFKKNPYEKYFEGLLGEKSIKLWQRDKSPLNYHMKSINLKNIPAESFKGEWKSVWENSFDRVSHIPEDIALEKQMELIRCKIRDRINDDNSTVSEFKGSLMDGIDIKETIRNSYKDQKIYVRINNRENKPVSNIVIIFTEDDRDYNWKGVWYAEHSQESDLVIYATEPGSALVGPGISKCRFGGYASIFPPRQIFNFFEYKDQLPWFVNTASEVLLFTALYYSENSIIPYIAEQIPSKEFYKFAEVKKCEIYHLPLNFFSLEKVRKLQKFHVLGDKRLRKIANHYII